LFEGLALGQPRRTVLVAVGIPDAGVAALGEGCYAALEAAKGVVVIVGHQTKTRLPRFQ